MRQISQKRYESLKRHDYVSKTNGVTSILTMDRTSGGTVLEPVEVLSNEDFESMLISKLSKFNPSDITYKHNAFPQCYYSAGIRCLADTADAFWLIDVVFATLLYKRVSEAAKRECRLVVAADRATTLEMIEDGQVIYSKIMSISTFPLPHFEFLFITEPGTRKHLILLKNEF